MKLSDRTLEELAKMVKEHVRFASCIYMQKELRWQA
jgi:hypothetical protein